MCYVLYADWIKSNTRFNFLTPRPEIVSKFYQLYGRDIEYSILSSALEKSCAGSLEVTLLSGPEGSGKSKLASSKSELVAIRGGILFRASVIALIVVVLILLFIVRLLHFAIKF